MQLFSHLPKQWHSAMAPHLQEGICQALDAFLHQEDISEQIFPPKPQRFAAFELAHPKDVRVVIVGQDPYHGRGQAHGLSFSVPDGVNIPPSLVNIYKEIARDFGLTEKPLGGNLTCWAKQGVMLLNTVLTVREDLPASHQKQGWEHVTDAALRAINEQSSGAVFLLWGAHAAKKKELIDPAKHLILQAPHPSPLSAHRGFLGCGHFSKANAWLVEKHQAPIDWTCTFPKKKS